MFVIAELQITRNSQSISTSVWRMAVHQWNKFHKILQKVGEGFHELK